MGRVFCFKLRSVGRLGCLMALMPVCRSFPLWKITMKCRLSYLTPVYLQYQVKVAYNIDHKSHCLQTGLEILRVDRHHTSHRTNHFRWWCQTTDVAAVRVVVSPRISDKSVKKAKRKLRDWSNKRRLIEKLELIFVGVLLLLLPLLLPFNSLRG